MNPCSPLFIFRWLLGWHSRSGARAPRHPSTSYGPGRRCAFPWSSGRRTCRAEGSGGNRIVGVHGWDRAGEGAATWAPRTPRGTRRRHPRRAGARARRAGAHDFYLIARGSPLYPVIGAKSIVLWKAASLVCRLPCSAPPFNPLPAMCKADFIQRGAPLALLMCIALAPQDLTNCVIVCVCVRARLPCRADQSAMYCHCKCMAAAIPTLVVLASFVTCLISLFVCCRAGLQTYNNTSCMPVRCYGDNIL